MSVAAHELRRLRQERRLLQDVVAVARRCDGHLPLGVLDAVLSGSSAVRPLLPAPRAGGSS